MIRKRVCWKLQRLELDHPRWIIAKPYWLIVWWEEIPKVCWHLLPVSNKLRSMVMADKILKTQDLAVTGPWRTCSIKTTRLKMEDNELQSTSIKLPWQKLVLIQITIPRTSILKVWAKPKIKMTSSSKRIMISKKAR